MQNTADHPQLHELKTLWESKRGANLMPARNEIDITELMPWMGNLTILEVVNKGQDFYFRLHGINIVNLYGHEMTGKYASTLPAPVKAKILKEYRNLIACREPVLVQRRHVMPAKDYTRIIKLLLPFSSDNENVDQIFSCSYSVS